MDIPRVPSVGSLYATSSSRFSTDGVRGSVMDPIDFSDQIRVEFTELSSRVELPKAIWKDKEVPETKEVPCPPQKFSLHRDIFAQNGSGRA